LYAGQAWLRRKRIQTEQKLRALEQRAEREERRSEQLVASADGSRRGRPVRIEVDALDADEVSGQPSTRRCRSPGEDDPTPHQRYLRIDVDDAHHGLAERYPGL